MKKITALVLVIMILISTLPLQVFALNPQLLQNDNAANAILLEQLKSYFGDDADGYLQALEDLGFLDEDGNFVPTEFVLVDGEEMTLAEVEDMINDPETDLSKEVTVDDYSVTLDDLRLMIEIEKEIARIYTTYYTEQEWTEEQLAMLDSLNDSAENGGLNLPENFSLNTTDEPITSGSFSYEEYSDLGVQRHTATVEISSASYNVGVNPVTAKLDITVTGAIPNTVISGKIRTVNVTAIAGEDFTGIDGQEFSVSTNASGAGSQSVDISLLKANSATTNHQKTLLVQAYDIIGASNTRASGVINLNNTLQSTPEQLYNTYHNDATAIANRSTYETGHLNHNFASLELDSTAKKLVNLGVFTHLNIIPHISGFYSQNPTFTTGIDRNDPYSISMNSLFASSNTKYLATSTADKYDALIAARHNYGGNDNEILSVRNAFGVDMSVTLNKGKSNEETIFNQERGLSNDELESIIGRIDSFWFSSPQVLHAESLDKVYLPEHDPYGTTQVNKEFEVTEGGQTRKAENTNNDYYHFHWDGAITAGPNESAMNYIQMDVLDSFKDTDGVLLRDSYSSDFGYNTANSYDLDNHKATNPVDSSISGSDYDYELTSSARTKISGNSVFSALYSVNLSAEQLEGLAAETNPYTITVAPKLVEARLVWLFGGGTKDSYADAYLTDSAAGLWAYQSGSGEDTSVEARLVDNTAPKLLNAEVMRISNDTPTQAGDFYQQGDLVPVKFTFSEPVAFTSSAVVTLTHNDASYPSVNHSTATLASHEEYVTEHVFYFEIPNNAPSYYTDFTFTNNSVKDLAGQKLVDYSSVKLDPENGDQNQSTSENPYIQIDVINDSINKIVATQELSPVITPEGTPVEAINVVVDITDEAQELIASGAKDGELPDYDENLKYSTVIKAKVSYLDKDGALVETERNLHFSKLVGNDLGTELTAIVPVPNISATNREVLVEVVEIGATPSEDTIITGVGNFAAITLSINVFIDKDDITLTTPSYMEEDTDGVYVFEYGEISGPSAKEAMFTIDLVDATPFYTFPESYEITSSNDDIISAQLVAETPENPKSSTVELIVGAAGEATITVVATNGGYTTSENIVDNYTKEIKFKIIPGTDPFFAVQSGQDKIESYIAAPFAVNFLSNLCEHTKDGDSTTFKLEVKDAAGDVVHTQELIYTFGDSDVLTNFVIPANAITSTGDYTAEITTDFEGISNKLQYDITILANPVVATLSRPDNRYITDATYESGAININWNLENWDNNSDGNASFSLTVTDENGVETSYFNGVPTTNSGSFALSIPTVNATTDDYRDTYTINLKAKNSTDINTSQDSFILYVYPDDLVKLYVNHEDDVPVSADAGAKQGPSDNIDLTLSNRDRISAMEQDAILMLERNIQLEAYLSTNHADVNYGQASDQFRWDVAQTDEEKAEVAALYKYQNSAYFDLRSLVNGAYMAQESMLLAGLADGDATITATHDNTGDSAKVNLTVETLYNHLYLVDAYPDVETSYYYYDENNNKISGKSNSEGKIAIYDENGIQSNLYLESEYNGEKYLGTIFQGDLVSGEDNSAYNVLYPENAIELRRAAYADIYLKNDDGTNFQGDVVIRAGVYIDGIYEEDAQFSFDGGANYHKGNEDMHTTVSSAYDGGLVSITMDITQFADRVTNEQDIEYIFEVYPEGKYPIIIHEDPTVNVDYVHATGDFLYYLKSASKTEAFIGYSTVGYNNNNLQVELDKDIHNIGPNDVYDSVQLNTSIYWWGQDYNDSSMGQMASLSVIDENGLELKGQVVTTEKHPFSDMWRTIGTVLLDEEQMNHMSLLPKESRVLKANLYKEEDEVYKTVTYGQSVINLLGLKTVDEDEDLQPNLNTISDLRVDGEIDDEIINNDDIFVTGFSTLTKVLSFTMGEPVEILFEPTADPLVYTGLISKNANQSDVGYDETGTEHTVSYNFFDQTQNRSKTKQSRNDQRKMANGTYAEKLDKDLNNLDELARGNMASGGRVIFTPPSLGGYIEAEFRYDPQADKWDMELVSGGLSADTVFGYRYSWNFLLGGVVPVTTTLEMGALLGIAADFQSGEHYARDEFIQTGPNSDDILLPEAEKGIDILTELRVGLYFEIFGGLGFDASVIAAKIGIFGRMDAILGFRWLNRPYLGDENFQDEYYIPEVIDTTSLDVTNHEVVTYDEVLTAGDIEFKGRVGLRAELKFLAFEKTYEFFSVEFAGYNTEWGQWNAISDIWLRNDRINGNPVDQVIVGGAEMLSINYGTTMESRSYLDARSRDYNVQATSEWEDRTYIDDGRNYGVNAAEYFSLDEGASDKFPGMNWENIYPHSTPLISDDGKIMVYIDDMESKNVEDMRVNYSLLDGSNNVYNQGSVIPGVMFDDGSGNMVEEQTYGDVQLAIDGSESNLAVAYVRQSDAISKDEGVQLTDAEVMQMMNLTEVYVSYYSGGAWTTTRVTDNASADLAPVVATNGNKTIVAWREVAATDYSDPTNFDSKDRVMYSISSDKGASWSEAKVLYDGSKGGVMSISADMLADGTAAIVYSYDETVNVGEHDMEIAAAIIENSSETDEFTGNNSVKIINLTEDESLNENVQLTTTNVGGEEHFLLGWFNQTIEIKEVLDEAGMTQQIPYEVPEIKFAAINNTGGINANIPETLSSVTSNSGVEVGSDFIFSKNSTNLTDLALAWIDVAESGSFTVNSEGETLGASASTYTVNSAKFVDINGAYGLSAVTEIAEMPENVVPAHFDLYKANVNGDTYNAIILGTNYGTGFITTKNTTLTTTNEDGQLVEEGLIIPSNLTITNMYSATTVYENSVRSDDVYIDFDQVRPLSTIDVVFTLTNTGKDVMTDAVVEIGGAQAASVNGLNLLPGETTTINGKYALGQKIEDVNYTINATFSDATNATVSSKLYLDYPDVGISKFEMIEEQDGMRTIALALNNATNIPLEDSGKTVKMALYSSPEYTEDSRIDDISEIVISDNEELRLIDKGGYTSIIDIDLEKILAKINTDEDGNPVSDDNKITEIPMGGIEVYAKAWIEVGTGADTYEQMELYPADNYASTSIVSLLEKSGNAPVSISTELTHASNTTAEVSVLNNSLTKVETGNLLAQLLDENGKVIETLQSYSTSQPNDGLLTLTGEQEVTKTFSFSQKGASVLVNYGETVDVKSTELTSISIQGIPVDIYDFSAENNARIVVQNIVDTAPILSIMTKSATANIKPVFGTSADNEDSGNIYAGTADLSTAVNEIVFTVEDGNQTATYTIEIIDLSKLSTPIIRPAVTENGITTVEIVVAPSTKNDELVSIIPDDVMNDAVQQVLDEAGKTNTTPKILVTVADQREDAGVEIDINPETLAELAIVDGAILEIESNIGSVSFDKKSLESMIAQAGGEIITIIIEPASDLTEKQVISIDGRVAYEITVMVGNKVISDFGDGVITIAVDYALKVNENPDTLKVYKIAEDGTMTVKDSRYNEANARAIFSTSTLSVYMIDIDTLSNGDGDTDVPMTGDNSMLEMFVVFLVIASTSIIVLNRKRFFRKK